MPIAALSWSLELAYLICLFVGLSYGIIAGGFSLLGGHLGGGEGVDSVGHTAVEVSEMGHEPGAADAGIHMSPWNPVVVSIFLVSFGGVGLAAMQLFGWNYASLAVAAPSGFVMGAITLAIFEKIFSVTQSSSEPTQQEMVGREAEVITPIPENGLGEIAYTRRGARFTASARSESGTAIARLSSVKVVRIVGNTFYVRPTSSSNP